MAPLRSLVLAVLVLAGCLQASAPAAPAPTPTVAAPAEFSDTTGAIEGLVHGDDLLPIQGANVTLSTGAQTTTDAAGMYAFSLIPPGEHILRVDREGYGGSRHVVRVAAAQLSRLDVLLTQAAIDETYHVTQIQAGVIGCSVGLRGVLTLLFSGCLLLGDLFTEKNPLLYDLPGRPSTWRGGVLETQWRTTQMTGRSLAVAWDVQGCDTGLFTQSLGYRSGESPLRIHLNASRLQDYRTNSTVDRGCGQVDAVCNDEKGCRLESYAFAYARFLGGPQDAAVYLQQSFNQYHTTFFGWEPSPQFSALPDA